MWSEDDLILETLAGKGVYHWSRISSLPMETLTSLITNHVPSYWCKPMTFVTKCPHNSHVYRITHKEDFERIKEVVDEYWRTHG